MSKDDLNIIPKPKESLPAWVNLCIIVAVALLLILAGIFLYFKLQTANWQEKAHNKEIEYLSLSNPVNKALEEKAGKISKQLNNFSNAFLERRVSSNIFDFLKAICHPNVTFGNFDFSVGSGELRIKGEADSYKTLGEQILALKDNPNLYDFRVSDITLSKEGKITFNVEFKIKLEFFQNKNQ